MKPTDFALHYTAQIPEVAKSMVKPFAERRARRRSQLLKEHLDWNGPQHRPNISVPKKSL